MRKNRKQREGPQSPVGRGRWGGALLQAGFEPAIYVTTVDDVNHYTTLPPILSVWGDTFKTCTIESSSAALVLRRHLAEGWAWACSNHNPVVLTPELNSTSRT